MKTGIRNNAERHPTPWLNGRVANGYWSHEKNRHSYMKWLGQICGFVRAEDWYRISKRHFYANCGGGLLSNYYCDSPILAVKEYWPEISWSAWLFKCVPQGFWQKVENRRAYMDWLGMEMQFKSTSDWYRIIKQDFYARSGGGLLANYYHDSPYAALNEYRPEYPWKAWLFASTPQCYWHQRAHRREYMDWLGKQLGIRHPEEWSVLKRKHFVHNSGAGLLSARYADCPLNALREYLPQGD